ncbi:MAG TPA: glycosyltransferase [Acidimicrobiales bacterium]|nr:glycosyltransferase [Acidimicrobiales bacterium]
MSPSVLVTVGTDHHPFDRLVSWMDAWAATHPRVDVFVQHGTASAPEIASGAPLVDPADLAARMARATAVVTHGGLSSIMESRAAGFLPLVVARDPERGEHVDFHQQRFTTYQDQVGRIRLLDSEAALHASLDAALDDPTTVRLPDGLADVSAAVEEVGGLIDDLLARRPSRHRRTAPL